MKYIVTFKGKLFIENEDVTDEETAADNASSQLDDAGISYENLSIEEEK